MTLGKIILVIVLLVGGVFAYRYLSASPPGVMVPDQGRDHVTAEVVASTQYNSNPPTSGPHLPTWVKPGVYAQPQQEGELIHSLEHGYIVISYNCGVHLNSFGLFVKVYAHEEGSPSASLDGAPLATGSAINNTQACQILIRQLTEFANGKRLWKLIVVPRPQLDTTLAVTAWGRIDTFDTFDRTRLERFIDYYRDHGPEQTME